MILKIDTDGTFHSFGIQYIIVNNQLTNQSVYYIYHKIETLRFSQHVHAFLVIQTKVWGCIAHTKLISFFPNHLHIMADENYYVSCT